VTKTEELPAIEERLINSGIGQDELADAFQAVSLEGFINRLGIRSLSLLVAEVLARHYSADIFPEGSHFVAWSSNEGGREIDPGVKWIACLRLALKEVAGAE
jgi:hypothetical protein